jgi:hypothetical protein
MSNGLRSTGHASVPAFAEVAGAFLTAALLWRYLPSGGIMAAASVSLIAYLLVSVLLFGWLLNPGDRFAGLGH